MADDVPPPESAGEAADNGPSDYRSLEQRLSLLQQQIDANDLSAEARHRDLLIGEIRQRIDVRNRVVVIAIVVMVFMAAVLTHAAHHYFWGPMVIIPPSVAIVMFLAPLVSITTITVMLLIGAFRRFKDDDIEKINFQSLAAEAIKSSQGL